MGVISRAYRCHQLCCGPIAPLSWVAFVTWCYVQISERISAPQLHMAPLPGLRAELC